MYKEIDSNKHKSILLIVIFCAFILFIGWIVSKYTSIGSAGLIIAGFFAFFTTLFGYYSGDKMALWSSGAQPLNKSENPYVYRMVENLCITAGLPTPKIYIINDSSPNAFATGRDPNHASIALTTGIIQKLENQELEGVIAHELSHVKNYDIRLMTLVIVLVGLINILARLVFQTGFSGNRDRSDRDNGSSIFLIVGIVLIVLSPIIAQLIKLAVSRKREYLADASGALLTRYPEGLASALEKISQDKQPLKRAEAATAHLYIANPFGQNSLMANLFSTHPPIQKRIEALRKMK
ncbi:MAG: M48 family metallopeptidase [Patescibacteria group bacterium]|nr:M48 family metallopeptidase [Patescibacteria group bacterium]MDD5164641.1 M48 family metallopeptidase [Patescibacteria group bacterium]MDD5534834.1 M48 family metallopeptidase [Patescibacteria group bacterium]